MLNDDKLLNRFASLDNYLVRFEQLAVKICQDSYEE